ncbi:ATP-binding cassette domain-containing protein [Vibrio sp. CAIM 722]|uniref:ATP-binding cassette domain-containing protein n=1 Tax=Vibrio eleionomae TaxID=2653505 RepID=A0A7X4RWQ4_9VIBR|nr:sugar ABC transporter ATP-binding protein [Vibrio eleionomae]MZI95918.1 ATP-binding cassette domain-containing protein [Vibrio eleionomae]
MDRNDILSASHISKRYGGVFALKDVSFSLKKGEILGLCGENGAGKSTLVKILGGHVTPNEGTLTIDGKTIVFGKRVDPALITIVHQELSILPDLTVLDNITLGIEDKGFFYRRGKWHAFVEEKLAEVGLSHISPNQLTGELSLAERQLVEIARGLASGAKVLLLDEPTATLSDAEINNVFRIMRRLKEHGTTMVMISHRLDEVFEITDRVTVFRGGEHIFTASTKDVTSEELVSGMLGHEVKRGEMPPVRKVGSPILECHQVMRHGDYGPFDFQCGKGEIVALVGQLGSGADTFLKSLAGLAPVDGGTISLAGTQLDLTSIAKADKQAISYVPEDRAGKGAFLEAPIGINLTSRALDRLSKKDVLNRKQDSQYATELATLFTLDPTRNHQAVSTLSGGNQQKVVLGKALATDPELLLLNEPTRGVDIGARADIYQRLRDKADNGLSIVFYSTDLEEILDFADRIVTVFKGGIVRNALRADVNREIILQDILTGTERSAA